MAKRIIQETTSIKKTSLWQRLLLTLCALGIFVLLGFIFWLVEEHLRNPNRYPLKTVKIEGDLKYLTKSDIEYATAEVARGGWFTVDLRKIKEAVEDIPWVDTVNIRRVWPATIELDITEQRAYSFWGEKGLLNIRGESYLPRNGSFPTNLPHLSGPKGTEKQLVRTFLEINQKIAIIDLSLKGLSLNQRGAWAMRLSNQIQVELGVDHIENKLMRLIKSYKILSQQAGQLIKIDCRYPNGLAVVRQAPIPIVGEGKS